MTKTRLEPAPAPAAPTPTEPTGVCPHCGYDLRGLPADRCPECGREFDRWSVVDSRIPWSHRRSLGTLPAFWRTVALVSLSPARFAALVPDNFRLTREGERFRALVVWHAAAGVALFLAAILWTTSDRRQDLVAVPVVAAASLGAGLVNFHLLAALHGLFAAGRNFWDPTDPAVRALVAADYASAALAWSPVTAALAFGGWVLGRWPGPFGPASESFVAVVVSVHFLWWWWNVLALFVLTTRPKPLTLLSAAVIFPLRAAALGIFTLVFVVLPLVGCGSFVLMLLLGWIGPG